VIETKKKLFIFQLLFFIFFNEDIKFEKKKKKERKERKKYNIGKLADFTFICYVFQLDPTGN